MTQGTLKATEPLKQEPPIAEKGDRKGVKIFFLAGGALFIAIAVLGISSRSSKTSGLQQQSNDAAQIVVNVVHPEKRPRSSRFSYQGRPGLTSRRRSSRKPVVTLKSGISILERRLRLGTFLRKSTPLKSTNSLSKPRHNSR